MKSRTWLLIGAAAIAAIAYPAIVEFPTALIWNASPSVSLGLYRVRPVDRFELSDLVLVDAPGPLERFMEARGYLPPDTPLLKHVAGLPGQTVCRIGRAITVDDVPMGAALEVDRLARPMPAWQGCQRIAADEIFLMNQDAEDSLDGRYFGPIRSSSILGSAVPLWTAEDDPGRFRWHITAR
jgi:conjugative transfer signal peptidase TraF